MSGFALAMNTRKLSGILFRKCHQSGMRGHKENQASALSVKGLEREKHFAIALSHVVFILHTECSHNKTMSNKRLGEIENCTEKRMTEVM